MICFKKYVFNQCAEGEQEEEGAVRDLAGIGGGGEEGGGSDGGPLTSVCGLQHRLAEGQVPVVLGAVLLKVLPCHVLRGALLKFHFAEAAILRCALGEEKRDALATHLLGKVGRTPE